MYNNERSKIKEKIKNLPNTPGVYKFLDSKGRVIYVGKAKNLKKRVSSYFRKGKAHDARIEKMKSEIRDIALINAFSEAEALIYEAGLIKDLCPRFNVELKDDKSYPFLKLTVNEDFPRLFVTRKRVKDGARYYGPYVNATLLRDALSFMKKVFKLRSCKCLHKKVCLEYHIGQCDGPCEGKVSRKEYARIVEQVKMFLEGKKADLIVDLEKDMFRASKKKDYEKALAVKNRIQALTSIQKMHDRAKKPVFGELEELKNALGLSDIPLHIECFDISNTGGVLAVGSMVKFVAGQPKRSGYRKFKIREIKGVDDYSMIREVVRRRYARVIKEGSRLPDLILFDGGWGHLNVAREELVSMGLDKINIASIAKEYNHVYVQSRKMPVRFSPGSGVLLFIQRIRDEAHRFAITYHRKLRREEKFDTELRKIKGVGPVYEKKLIEAVGGIGKIKKLSKQELILLGINKKTAGNIKDYYKNR